MCIRDSSWWIVHTQPTEAHDARCSRIPPTQLVDRSYTTYRGARRSLLPNPTNAVGGSFIHNLQRRTTLAAPESHQRSWWIVHTQPTEAHDARCSRIPPTQLVDRSYTTYRGARRSLLPNPTNAVGGSFIHNLQRRTTLAAPESHQRSWWIVHTQPTEAHDARCSRIPPTQLVDRSYTTYRGARRSLLPNPTNAVGGSFIHNLQRRTTLAAPESHQRSWWIVHTQPTEAHDARCSRIPPTQLVDRSYIAF